MQIRYSANVKTKAGIYRLLMKKIQIILGIHGCSVIENLKSQNLKILIFEPLLDKNNSMDSGERFNTFTKNRFNYRKQT